jgi:hypothetical protein
LNAAGRRLGKPFGQTVAAPVEGKAFGILNWVEELKRRVPR